MNVFHFQTINQGYIELVRRILIKPDYYQSVTFLNSGKGPNVNKKSRFHLRNVHILIQNPGEFEQFDVLLPERSKKMNDYMHKEQILFDNGIIDADQMSSISKLWGLIRNPDKKTINANYGYMVYYLKDAGNLNQSNMPLLSQFEWCKQCLIKNPETLQAVMHFHRPKDQFKENLDQPCTMFTQFTVENGYLNFHSFMRSNDIIYGTPYNIAYFKLLQKRMLLFLNAQKCSPKEYLKFGYLHHNVTSLHLYEDKISIAKQIVNV